MVWNGAVRNSSTKIKTKKDVLFRKTYKMLNSFGLRDDYVGHGNGVQT